MPQQATANHYEIAGGVDGVVDTSSLSGKPGIELRVGGQQVTEPELRDAEIGIEVTGIVDAQPDRYTEFLRLLLPRVNIRDEPLLVAGVAIVTRVATTIAGPGLVDGAIESYRVVPVAVRAFAVDF